MSKIQFRDDVFRGENHPQCCFFEEFPSSADPNETFFGALYCHMSNREEHAEMCKGDYFKCPLAYGKSAFQLIPAKADNPSGFPECVLRGVRHDPLEKCLGELNNE